MFRQMKLTAKIVGSIVVTLALTSAISFWITQHRINREAEEAFRDKIRQITGMAAATRNWVSENIDTIVPGREFKHLTQVPVVAAWGAAQQYAKAQDMDFRTPSLTPRNPKNQPDEFERRALEAFQRDPSLKEFSERRVENGKEVMRYAQPVRLTQDCLLCHGDPAGQKDPFGFTKEGMKAGDLRGAFVVRASTEQLLQTASSNSIGIFLTSFLILLAAASVVFALVRKLVIRPLSASVDLANKIASHDLAANDLPVEARDEIGEATSALNSMKNNLRGMMQSIATTAEHVASASEELAANAMQTASGGETQKDQVHQIATAMQEMSATVHEVSENCNQAAESAHKASETARGGGVIVEDTLTLMRSIADSVRESAKSVQELGSRSNQIGKIVGVIDDIADQTNLLALNAAIEAARAGEQGRGFAVVADEVRKLAERTTKATKEIAEMIQSVQAETRSAVDKMQSGTQQVEKGVEVTAKAGESLKQIIGQAEHVGEMVTHIATAANQQSSTTEQVNSNMEQINRLVAESAEGAQQSAKACEQLSSLALELQNLVSRFKLGQQTPGGVMSGGYRSPRQMAADPVRVRTALALSPKPEQVYQHAGHDRDGVEHP